MHPVQDDVIGMIHKSGATEITAVIHFVDKFHIPRDEDSGGVSVKHAADITSMLRRVADEHEQLTTIVHLLSCHIFQVYHSCFTKDMEIGAIFRDRSKEVFIGSGCYIIEG